MDSNASTHIDDLVEKWSAMHRCARSRGDLAELYALSLGIVKHSTESAEAFARMCDRTMQPVMISCCSDGWKGRVNKTATERDADRGVKFRRVSHTKEKLCLQRAVVKTISSTDVVVGNSCSLSRGHFLTERGQETLSRAL